MGSADALLFVYSDPGAVPVAEFNDWYDNEHGPARLTVPEEIFLAVRGHFSERETLELTVTVAAYNMVSRVLVALEVRPGDNPFQEG